MAFIGKGGGGKEKTNRQKGNLNTLKHTLVFFKKRERERERCYFQQMEKSTESP